MIVTRVAGQETGATADSATAIGVTFPANVQALSRVVMCVGKFSPASSDAFVLGDISQIADGGDATLGSFTMDSQSSMSTGGGFIHSAIYSASVTAPGVCTLQVGGGLSGSFWMAGVTELASTAGVDGSGTGSGSATAPATTAVNSTNGAAFVGIVTTNSTGATTHTPGTSYDTIFESEDGAAHVTGSAIIRITQNAFTDTARWTAPTTVDWVAVLAVYKVSLVTGGGKAFNPVIRPAAFAPGRGR